MWEKESNREMRQGNELMRDKALRLEKLFAGKASGVTAVVDVKYEGQETIAVFTDNPRSVSFLLAKKRIENLAKPFEISVEDNSAIQKRFEEFGDMLSKIDDRMTSRKDKDLVPDPV